ncbi:MAG: amino acid permease, partial [Polyangiaceae bacterium]|nr:amino acid permease [Polyangiaceae bacterium]
IGVAHIISIATGLSISSIATDKNVGAGGPYYIVSRSLGLPIGGALGLALFLGLCFGTSLYIIGFSESILSFFSIEATPNNLRITGTLALVAVAAVTIISTSFALKTQYVVLSLIGISLVAIFLGRDVPLASTSPIIQADAPPSEFALFAIFFPAVTGFTAGVNMSGDLKNPKSAIPKGTLLAILTGLVVYVALTIFLSLRVPSSALIDDPNVLSSIAFHPWAVTAGIWGATFSSALGSLMGAPRILQALSVDRVTPRFFAHGRGLGNEPFRALAIAFLIAECGIIIAELNQIARIVSMVFLTLYAFLNISCAIEAKVSPDFRPSFRIPASISVIGALTCFLVMALLDIGPMLGAIILMLALFGLLQRRALKLESGDAWSGIWQNLIRTGLPKLLGKTAQNDRHWSPIVLDFGGPSASGSEHKNLQTSLVGGSGFLTRLYAAPPASSSTQKEDNLPGLFQED